MTAKGSIGANVLQDYIHRVEKLMEERRSIQGDIREVFSEAKGKGYDVKTMRRLIVVRAQDAADRAEQETLLDTYMHAMGMETFAHVIEPTEEALIEQASRIVAEVDRCMALAAGGVLPKIEAIKDLIGCSTGKAHKLRGLVAERLSRSKPIHRENENVDPDGVIESAAGVEPPVASAAGKALSGGANETGSPAATPLERQEDGDLTAAADCRVSTEPAVQAVNAAPSSGRVSPEHQHYGQGSEVGTYSERGGAVYIAPAPGATIIDRPPPDTRSFDDIAGPMPERLRRARA